ncbi:MAG: class II glutamine amidotransferase, partial [Chlamydiia bacterium]|nr:class II glutamine amidotransferase [Chlamydiia bacterium]
WNDENLLNIASKVTSDCFIGHVRASTVGDVSLANCHPFTCDEYLFAHNGTIDNFEAIRKDLLFFLEDDCFHKIKGQTDSEHFFYLIYHILKKHDESMGLAIIAALKKLNHILTKRQLTHNFRINACLTNGKTLSAIRFKSNADQPTLSLYYSQQHSPKSVIIASERLSEMNEEWLEIPSNHLLTVDEEINITLTPIHI